MIKVTRLNGEEFYVNSDLIEFIERTPDTVITLTTGRKFVVKEDVLEVIDKIIDFRNRIIKVSLGERIVELNEEQQKSIVDGGRKYASGDNE